MINTNYGNYYGSSTAAVCNTLSGSVSTTVDTDAVQEELKSKCEDGSDDGDISFGEKVGSFFKGIGNVFKNVWEGIKSDPIGSLGKIALGVGLVALTAVTGPIGLAASAVVLGMSAYGVVKGVKTVVDGAVAASNAGTDAEAKAAWENIGSGTFQTAVSAVAAKGAMGAFKANAVAVGARMTGTAANTAGTAAADAAGTTASTTASTGGRVFSKIGNTFSKAKATVGKGLENFGNSPGGFVKTTFGTLGKAAKSLGTKTVGAAKMSLGEAAIRGTALTLSGEADETHTDLDAYSDNIETYNEYLQQKADSEEYYANLKNNYNGYYSMGTYSPY
jgi:hypothetical protein